MSNVEELVERVIILEDIAADSAVQICALFSLVRDKAHEVFMMSDDEHEGKDTSKMDCWTIYEWNRYVIHWWGRIIKPINTTIY